MHLLIYTHRCTWPPTPHGCRRNTRRYWLRECTARCDFYRLIPSAIISTPFKWFCGLRWEAFVSEPGRGNFLFIGIGKAHSESGGIGKRLMTFPNVLENAKNSDTPHMPADTPDSDGLVGRQLSHQCRMVFLSSHCARLPEPHACETDDTPANSEHSVVFLSASRDVSCHGIEHHPP